MSKEVGRVRQRRRLSRWQFERSLERKETATAVMETCGMAHSWGRYPERAGHQVVLLPPHAVWPYVLRNKTDGADARALLEALLNQELRPVPVKQVDPYLLAGLHRMRSAWLTARTAHIHRARGLLRELGLMIPLGARRVVPSLRARLEAGQVPEPLGAALAEASHKIEALEQRVRYVERALDRLASTREDIQRLQTIPGVGLLTATASAAKGRPDPAGPAVWREGSQPLISALHGRDEIEAQILRLTFVVPRRRQVLCLGLGI